MKILGFDPIVLFIITTAIGIVWAIVRKLLKLAIIIGIVFVGLIYFGVL